MHVAKTTRMTQGLGRDLPLGTDPAAVRRRIEGMEKLLERGFTLPGTKQVFGLDVILDLIPGVGTSVGAVMGLYMAWEARNLGMSKWQVTRMAANVGVDTLIGAIPLVGDLFDFAFRSNSMNLRIIRRHLDRHHPATRIIDL